MRLDRISHVMVLRWFDAYSRTAPGGANRVLDVLRQILNHALVCGHIAANPAMNTRRNPRAKLTRFLSREEIQRLHRVLDGYTQSSESACQQADIIRLLLLTGCRKSEIVRLRWQEVDGDRLNLTDSKTGPRTVYLNAKAREIIERGALPLGDHPTDHVSAEDVEQHVQVEVRLGFRPQQARDVPTPQNFVSQRHRVNALSNHRLHLVKNLPALAPITERTRHFRRQTDPAVDFAQ